MDKLEKHQGWENIYKELGVVQTEIMPCVKIFSELLFKENNKNLIILDSGCGTGRHSMFVLEKLGGFERFSLKRLTFLLKQ